jgi:hypothetical protein
MSMWHCTGCDKHYAAELPPCPRCNEQAPPLLPHAHALFEEAERLINGPRKSTYGHYTDEAKAIAAMWTELLRDVLRDGARIEPRKVPLMMIAMKLNRMKVKAHHDSVVDTVGYAGLLAELEAVGVAGVV